MRTHVPPSRSDHPDQGKFGFRLYRTAWRAWLQEHHGSERGSWVLSWRRESGIDAVPYEDLVLEALCFGWIDSTAKIFDADRRMIMMTPRKARSGWTRLNRQRIEALKSQGLMADAGRRAVEVAKANGWWSLMDSVEDLVVPDDLAAALDGIPSARESWDATPPSARKQALWWLITAAKDETRARRIATIVTDAAEGRAGGRP